MAEPRPQLAELSRALDSLSQEKLRYLCVELGVPPATLSNIDASHPRDALRCITEYLEALLAYDESLSWERIVEVLSTSRLRQKTLAVNIKERYCPGPLPQSYSSPQSVSSSCDDEVSGTSGFEFSTPYPTPTPPRLYDIDSPPQLKPALLPANDLSPSVKSKPNAVGQKYAKKITGLKTKFRSIVISSNSYLSQIMSRTDIEHFKIDLTTLPMMGKTHHFLKKKRKKIRKAKSVQKVFDILDPYWNHVDYALLEHIVVNYCDDRIKRKMEKYKKRLHKFEKATSVKQFMSVAAKSHPVPKGYSTMTATLNMDAEECSLYHVREIKDSIVERANLEPYVALLQDIHASFVVLTIAFPAAGCQHVKSALDVDFLLGLGISPDSVTFGSVPRQQVFVSRLASIRNRFITREQVLKPVSSGQTVSSSESSSHHEFHHFPDDEASSLMPDPPQNVREEV
ncbi:hypothetical protein GBAR_LOCUS29052, partial [Geodia barretti]